MLTTNAPEDQLKLDHQDKNKNTALHLACLQAHEECALVLLDKSNDNITQLTNAEEKT